MINLIWAAMILIGILTALLTGHMEDVNSGIIASGEEAVTLCITMLGIVTMWSGIMKIAERTGLMKKWSKKMSPVMKFLFPGVPPDSRHHQVHISILAFCQPNATQNDSIIQRNRSNSHILGSSIVQKFHTDICYFHSFSFLALNGR